MPIFVPDLPTASPYKLATASRKDDHVATGTFTPVVHRNPFKLNVERFVFLYLVRPEGNLPLVAAPTSPGQTAISVRKDQKISPATPASVSDGWTLDV